TSKEKTMSGNMENVRAAEPFERGFGGLLFGEHGGLRQDCLERLGFASRPWQLREVDPIEADAMRTGVLGTRWWRARTKLDISPLGQVHTRPLAKGRIGHNHLLRLAGKPRLQTQQVTPAGQIAERGA